ncbi:hypothetical protein GALMADRAFT_75566, partial [Galerina marginata CBS 339.88]
MKSGNEWRASVGIKRQDAIQERITSKIRNSQSQNCPETIGQPNVVKVVGLSELESGQVKRQEDNMIDTISAEFLLNEEQDRAFRIAASHIVNRTADKLKMYIGGMAGTGKTRALKAIAALLERRGESRRLLIMAPTGTAAALLGGSTYHYILGMREGDDSSISQRILAAVKERMEGVDFVFFDEVSMLSCFDLYRICERIAL